MNNTSSPQPQTPSLKAFSSAGSSQDGKGSSDGAPFVLFENPDTASHQSATISFWFPRPGRTNAGNVLPTHSRRRGPQWHTVDRDSTTAIQPGKPIDIFASKNVGLLVTFAAVGYFNGMLPLLIQALYKSDSKDARRLVSSQHFAQLVRLLFALLSDIVLPSTKNRRRIFLVIGWGLTVVFTAILAAKTSSGSDWSSNYNPLLMVLSLCITLASVSADGLMVEYAHREDIQERGCIQMLLLATRIVGELVGRSSLSTGSAPNAGSQCSGEIDCVLELQFTFTIASCISLVALLCSLFATRVPSRKRLALQGYAAATTASTKLHQAWTFHQHALYLAFLAFGFIQAASFAWAAPSAAEIATEWINMSGTSRWVSDGVNCSMQMIAALLMMALWRNTNWRTLSLVFVTVSTLLTRLPSDLLILFDVTKSHALFLACHHIASLCEALATMVRLLMAVEMAMPTMEATSFSLTTSAFDLGTIVGSYSPKTLATMRANEGAALSPAADWIIAVCAFLHVLRLTVGIFSLRLIPQQKASVHEQREDEVSTPSVASSAALVALGLLIFAAAALNVRPLIDGSAVVPWANYLVATRYSTGTFQVKF